MTLLYAARDETHNNAVALKRGWSGQKLTTAKPPRRGG